MPQNNPMTGMLSRQLGIPLDAEMEDLVSRHFRREEVGRKHMLFMNGDSNTRHYFVEKGLLRLFLLDPEGKEFNLETIEDSVLYTVEEEGLTEITNLLGKMAFDGSQDLFRRSYLFLQKRLVAILSRTAEENYLELKEKNPRLLQRLPQYHVASYLGVSPEFMSKIIRRTARK